MLPVLLMEPTSAGKRRRYSEILAKPKGRPLPSLEDIKEQLKEIRDYSLAHLNQLVNELTSTLSAYPEVEVVLATNVQEALETIKEVSDGTDRIAVNKSAVVAKELTSALVSTGFQVIESYYSDFQPSEDRLTEYWQTPSLTFESLFESFAQPIDLNTLRQSSVQKNGAKDFVGLLGLSAISASDGAVLMLQHTHNISDIFEQAKKIILVAGLDKVVRNLYDAILQTKCMAIFGSEALALDLQGKIGKRDSIGNLQFEVPPAKTEGRIHLILLDNGRSQIRRSRYRQLLSCISCRACNSCCPPYLSNRLLTPSELLLNFKGDLLEIGPDATAPSGIEEGMSFNTDNIFINKGQNKEQVWDCTTCHACHEACPVGVEPLDAIIGLRQSLVMEKATMPKTVERALRSIEDRGHPWRGTTFTRTHWAEDINIKVLAEDSDVDLLYWVGCTSALESRSIRIAQAMGKLFSLAGIKAGMLGAEEGCCGEPARRLGNEYLFQRQAEKNIEVMQRYNVKKIVTGCPHCYHTIKNEYLELGGEFEVVAHTEFVADLLDEQQLKVAGGGAGVVTYHDPCYLGRYNRVWESPRQILNSMSDIKLVEIKLNRERSSCCGGGGGHMWMGEKLGRNISEARIAQAIETGAQTIVTACPFCFQMFDDAIKTKAVEESLKVMDIAELVIESELMHSSGS